MASPVEDEDTDPAVEIVEPEEIPDGEFDTPTPPTIPERPPLLPDESK
jgi:hypothetical protein